MNKNTIQRVLDTLTYQSGTVHDVASRLETSKQNAGKYVRFLHQSGQIHITGWIRVVRGKAAIYAIGNGVDAVYDPTLPITTNTKISRSKPTPRRRKIAIEIRKLLTRRRYTVKELMTVLPYSINVIQRIIQELHEDRRVYICDWSPSYRNVAPVYTRGKRKDVKHRPLNERQKYLLYKERCAEGLRKKKPYNRKARPDISASWI